MVRKEIINKTITDIINKSHQHLTLNKQVINTFNKFAESTRNRKTEKAIITDDNGKILKKKNGNGNSVRVDEEVFLAYWDGNHRKPVHIEHNHPNKYHNFFPTKLSSPDMRKLLMTCTQVGDYFGENMVKSVTCEDSFNHSRMTLVRGDYFKTGVNHKENPEKYREMFECGQTFNKGISMLEELYGGETRDKYDKVNKKIFTDLWDKIEDKPPVKSKEYKQLQKEISIQSSDKALHEIGFYEQLKKVGKVFREANCKLTFEWVED